MGFCNVELNRWFADQMTRSETSDPRLPFATGFAVHLIPQSKTHTLLNRRCLGRQNSVHYATNFVTHISGGGTRQVIKGLRLTYSISRPVMVPVLVENRSSSSPKRCKADK